jgi:hypothetical protein
MKNILYKMMIRNFRNYLDTTETSDLEGVVPSIWTISEVIAIGTGKLKEDIVLDIVNCKLDKPINNN